MVTAVRNGGRVMDVHENKQHEDDKTTNQGISNGPLTGSAAAGGPPPPPSSVGITAAEVAGTTVAMEIDSIEGNGTTTTVAKEAPPTPRTARAILTNEASVRAAMIAQSTPVTSGLHTPVRLNKLGLFDDKVLPILETAGWNFSRTKRWEENRLHVEHLYVPPQQASMVNGEGGGGLDSRPALLAHLRSNRDTDESCRFAASYADGLDKAAGLDLAELKTTGMSRENIEEEVCGALDEMCLFDLVNWSIARSDRSSAPASGAKRTSAAAAAKPLYSDVEVVTAPPAPRPAAAAATTLTVTSGAASSVNRTRIYATATKRLPKYAGGSPSSSSSDLLFTPDVVERKIRDPILVGKGLTRDSRFSNEAWEGVAGIKGQKSASPPKLLEIEAIDVPDDPHSIELRVRGRRDLVDDVPNHVQNIVKLAAAERNLAALVRDGSSLELDVAFDTTDVTQRLGARIYNLPEAQEGLWVSGTIPVEENQFLATMGRDSIRRGAAILRVGGVGVRTTDQMRDAWKASCEDAHRTTAIVTNCLRGDADLGGIRANRVVGPPRRRDGTAYRGRWRFSGGNGGDAATRLIPSGATVTEGGKIKRRASETTTTSVPGAKRKKMNGVASAAKPPATRAPPSKPTGGDKSKEPATIAYLHFIKKYRPVRDIEYKDVIKKAGLVGRSMWKRHKAIYGSSCDENCRCPSDLERLTDSVVSDYLERMVKDNPDWKNPDGLRVRERPVGFVDNFMNKHFDKVQTMFPDLNPAEVLAKLVDLWSKHKLERRYGLTCKKDCPCGSIFIDKWLKYDKPKRSPAVPIARKNSSTSLKTESVPSPTQPATLIRKASGSKPPSGATAAPLSLARKASGSKPSSGTDLAPLSLARKTSTGPKEFYLTFDARRPLGFFLITDKSKFPPVCKILSVSPERQVMDERLRAGTVVTATSFVRNLVTTSPKAKIETHLQLQQRYGTVKSRRDQTKIRLWFVNSENTALISHALNKDEWDSSGAWQGRSPTPGWAGGAKLAEKKPAKRPPREREKESKRDRESKRKKTAESSRDKGASKAGGQAPSAVGRKEGHDSIPAPERQGLQQAHNHALAQGSVESGRGLSKNEATASKLPQVQRAAQASIESDNVSPGNAASKSFGSGNNAPERRDQLNSSTTTIARSEHGLSSSKSDDSTLSKASGTVTAHKVGKGPGLSILRRREGKSSEEPPKKVSFALKIKSTRLYVLGESADASILEQQSELSVSSAASKKPTLEAAPTTSKYGPTEAILSEDFVDAILNKGYVEVLKLLKEGAHPKQKDSKGKLPLDYVNSKIEELKRDRANSSFQERRKIEVSIRDFQLKRTLLKIYLQAEYLVDMARYLKHWVNAEILPQGMKDIKLTQLGMDHPSSDFLFCMVLLDGKKLEPDIPLVPLTAAPSFTENVLHPPKYVVRLNKELEFSFKECGSIEIKVVKGNSTSSGKNITLGSWTESMEHVKNTIELHHKKVLEGELKRTEYLESGSMSVKVQKGRLDSDYLRRKRAEIAKEISELVEWVENFEADTIDNKEAEKLFDSNVTLPASGNISLLHAAVYIADPNLVKRLLSLNADPSAKSAVGSPINLAVNLKDKQSGSRRDVQEHEELQGVYDDILRTLKQGATTYKPGGQFIDDASKESAHVEESSNASFGQVGKNDNLVRDKLTNLSMDTSEDRGHAGSQASLPVLDTNEEKQDRAQPHHTPAEHSGVSKGGAEKSIHALADEVQAILNSQTLAVQNPPASTTYHAPTNSHSLPHGNNTAGFSVPVQHPMPNAPPQPSYFAPPAPHAYPPGYPPPAPMAAYPQHMAPPSNAAPYQMSSSFDQSGLPIIFPADWVEGMNMRCPDFSRPGGCNLAARCPNAHIHSQIGPMLDDNARFNRSILGEGDRSWFAMRNVHVRQAVDSRGKPFYTAAYVDPRDRTVFYAERGISALQNSQGIYWYPIQDAAVAAVERVVYAARGSSNGSMCEQSVPPPPPPPPPPLPYNGRPPAIVGNAGNHVFHKLLSNLELLQNVYVKIYAGHTLKRTCWSVSRSGQGMVTVVFHSPAKEENGAVYYPAECGGTFSDGRWWYKEEREAKASAFVQFLIQASTKGLVTENLTGTTDGKAFFKKKGGKKSKK